MLASLLFVLLFNFIIIVFIRVSQTHIQERHRPD